ncbi:hypothetical protein [Natronococcus sp.]|uniref:hypothetical protein n=1 Tax=Natronococcus sp. TaxID=35747 RepID=UPI003A4E655A
MATDETFVRTLLLVLAVLFLLPVLLMLLAVPMMGLWGGGHTSRSGTTAGRDVGGQSEWVVTRSSSSTS